MTFKVIIIKVINTNLLYIMDYDRMMMQNFLRDRCIILFFLN